MLSTSAWKAFGAPVFAGEEKTTQDETFSAGRGEGRRHCRCADGGDGPHVRDVCISTAQDPPAYHPAAIVIAHVVGQHLGHRGPVAGREVRPKAVVCSACRVFQWWRLRAELVEPRERGVDVCLVE